MKLFMRKYARLGLVPILMAVMALAGCGGDGSSGGNDDDGVEVATCSVTYDGNSEDGGSVPVDDTDYQEGQTVTVLGNTDNLFKTGFEYAGWNTLADGSGTTYTQGQTFTMAAEDIILYALWTANPTWTVTYDDNGADGGTVPVDTTHYEEGRTVTVLENSGNLMRDSFTFDGWNTQADGSGTSYAPGQTFTMEADNVTLYAKWEDAGAAGEAGDLDTSFGGTGVVTTAIDGMGYAVLIQADGKILVAGSGDQATVVRYNANGTLDANFGTGGIATLPAGPNRLTTATALALESGDSDDFRIVVAGIGTSGGFFRMAAARLNDDGSLDTSFAAASVTPGIFYSPFTSDGSYGAQGVALQEDGKIVLVGETADKFAVVRLTTGGSLDATFGNPNGYVTTTIQDLSHAKAVAIQEDGKIVVAGQSYLGGFTNHAASIARYLTDGSLDIAGWGAGAGYILSPFITDPTALIIQNGRVVIAGEHLAGAHFEFAMIGIDADGWFDNTFGAGGFVSTPVGDDATAYAIAVGNDGILLAGHATIAPDNLLALARYSADGVLDTTFGSPDGYVFTVIGASPYPYGLAIDASDRVVVAGGQGMGPSAFFVARYLP